MALAACAAAPPAPPYETVTAPPPPPDETASNPPPNPDADAGLAWCTTPTPEVVRATGDLSSSTAYSIYAGHCIPGDKFYRACDDAGLPVYAPTCGDENKGTHIDITAKGHVLVSSSAFGFDLVPGPLDGGAWAIGPGGEALIAKEQTKASGALSETVRVVATSFKADDWGIPTEEFSDVLTNPDRKAFTFWRPAACFDVFGCVVARFEASAKGVRPIAYERDVYVKARQDLRTRVRDERSKVSGCPKQLLIVAARVYTMSRLVGDVDRSALAEFSKTMAGTNVSACKDLKTGRPLSLGVVRQDLSKEVGKLVAKANK